MMAEGEYTTKERPFLDTLSRKKLEVVARQIGLAPLPLETDDQLRKRIRYETARNG